MPESATSEPRTPWWLWPQCLSLDAPLVIMAWLAALARSHGQHLPGSFYVALGLATWVLYLVDRTGDATSAQLPPPLAARHAFCCLHQSVILRVIVPLGLAMLVWLVGTQLPQAILINGLPLACMAVIYLALFSTSANSGLRIGLLFAGLLAALLIGYLQAHDPRRNLLLIAALGGLGYAWMSPQVRGRGSWTKELFASLLIALGTGLAAHAWTPPEHAPMQMCAEVAMFWALVLVNLHGIASNETLHQPADTPRDAARRLLQPVLIAAVIGITLRAAQSAVSPGLRAFATTVLIAAALHGVLHFTSRKLKPELYHTLADLALLLPLPVMWIMV